MSMLRTMFVISWKLVKTEKQPNHSQGQEKKKKKKNCIAPAVGKCGEMERNGKEIIACVKKHLTHQCRFVVIFLFCLGFIFYFEKKKENKMLDC